MNKHTPGPWTVDTQERSDGDAIAIFPSGGGVCICEVVARSGEGRSNPIIQQTAESNAALIASAPELLEALQAVVKVWEGPRDRTCLAAIGFATAITQARAAIAKAEGKA